MKNKITLEQFRKLETLADAYNAAHENDVDEEFISAMLTTEFGDGPEPEATAVMATIQAYDWDGKTDFGTIRSMLESVGVEIEEREMIDGYEVCRLQNSGEWEPQSFIATGDCSCGKRMCNKFAYCLVIEK